MPVSHRSAIVARDLDTVFTIPRMRAAWQKTVRTGLRRQPLTDLHDFLDVHRNLDHYLLTLRTEVVTGQYRPLPPEIILVEKRDGIPRRMTLPGPADAILLQTVVDALEPAIKTEQPHPNAYYSRSHAPQSVQDVDGTFAYPWWLLWPEFQKRIWQFAQARNYVVVTDVANYFDCIPLSVLRNRIAACGAFKETVLNFLFFLLDAFTWRPFYMPSSGVGLPQLNFDAPRLLAHAYLFPVDEELQRRTGGDFVRWMDDINCGMADIGSARHLLRGLEIVLNSLGLRLNAAKTQILSGREALQHFWVNENRALTIMIGLLKGTNTGSPLWQAVQLRATKRYRKFHRRTRMGHWDKVYKRYFTIFGILRAATLQRQVPALMDMVAGLREPICRYYALLGPSNLRLQHLEHFLRSGRCLDDASLFDVVRTLIAWKGQVQGARRNAIVGLVPHVSRLGSDGRPSTGLTVAGVSASIWLLGKYGTATDLSSFLSSSESLWTRSSWAARQVAAATPLLPEADRVRVEGLLVRSGLPEALRVLASLEQLRRSPSLDAQLQSYLLHPPTAETPYPLGKAIVARVALSSSAPRKERVAFRKSLLRVISDPSYLSIVRRRP